MKPWRTNDILKTYNEINQQIETNKPKRIKNAQKLEDYWSSMTPIIDMREREMVGCFKSRQNTPTVADDGNILNDPKDEILKWKEHNEQIF